MALIEGDGTPESAWRAWLPPAHDVGVPRWLDVDQRLVVLAPHPDDEVLACGGLIAMHMARGGECLIVAATDGEGSDPGLAAEDARVLAAQRRRESEAGLVCLGLDETMVCRLGVPDGGIADQYRKATTALVRLLRPHDLLLTTWRHDGHPDHEAAGRCAAQAAEQTGARRVEAPVWMWHWARPGDLRVPWSRLTAVGLSPSARESKQAALARHRSQLAPRSNGKGPVLGAHAVDRARRTCEHYFV